MKFSFFAVLPLLAGLSLSVGEHQQVNQSPLTALVPLGSSEVSLGGWGDSVDIAFTGLLSRKSGIYFRRFDRARNSWSEAVAVSGHEEYGNHTPRLAVDPQGNHHLVWLTRLTRRKNVVSYSRLARGESQWSKPVRFPGGFGSSPSLTIDAEGRIYIYFTLRQQGVQSGRIALHVSDDGGLSWREANPNYSSDLKKGAATDPVLASREAGRVSMVWLDHTPGGKSVVFNSSEDGGKTWLKEPVAVSDSKYAYSQPRMLMVDDEMHVAWSVEILVDPGRRSEVWTTVSKDQGKTWSANRRVFSRHAENVEFDLFRSGRNIGCLWSERARQSGGGALLERIFWSSGRYVEQKERILRSSVREGYFQDLLVVRCGGHSAVAVTERKPFNSAQIVLLVSNSDGSEWTSRQLSEPKFGVDARGPAAICESDRLVCNIVFHEVRSRKFLLEPAIWNSNLMFTQVAFGN